jgi:hypothetical protein
MRTLLLSRLLCLTLALAPTALAQGGAPPDNSAQLSVAAFGAKADGASDDTGAVQTALETAGKAGGVVWLPAGRYLVAGSLRIPPRDALHGAAHRVGQWLR